MTRENEPQHGLSAGESLENHRDALATSLTDLIDQMDRAAFRRSLASRHLSRFENTSDDLRSPPKNP